MLGEGVIAYRDHDAERIEGANVVVYSSAIRPEHPDRLRAEQLAERGQLRLVHRMDFLSEAMADAESALCVAGTHGKTSTTSLLGWALLELGADPHILAGGKPLYLPEGFRFGNGSCAVYETDESDGSFLRAAAPLRLCLNIDADHLEYYGGIDELTAAFAAFIGGGALVAINSADPRLVQAGAKAGNRSAQVFFQTFEPEQTPADQTPEYSGQFTGNGYELLVSRRGELAGSFTLPLPGAHFASNALGAFALVDFAQQRGLLNIPNYSPERFFQALNRFPGVSRRLELLGRWFGAPVYDDYGHHPTELRAVIAALRPLRGKGGRLVVIFQPHRYTRTRRLADEFAAALSAADRLILLPIYAAGEDPQPDADEQAIASRLRGNNHGPAPEMLSREGLAGVGATLRPEDVVVALGAGDISKLIRAAID